MPIIGETDEDAGLDAFPQLGMLKKGAARVEGEWPADLDHFRPQFNDEYEHLYPLWNQLYGEQAREIRNVMLVAPTPQLAMSSWLEGWNSSGTLLFRTDGRKIILWYDTANETYSHEERDYNENDWLDKKGKAIAKRSVRLPIYLPDLVDASGELGIMTVTTSSFFDTKHLHGTLSLAYQLYGDLNKLRFILKRVPKIISTPMENKDDGEKYRGKTEKYLINLRIDPQTVKERLLPQGGGNTTEQPQLPAETPANKADDWNWFEDNDQLDLLGIWLHDRFYISWATALKLMGIEDFSGFPNRAYFESDFIMYAAENNVPMVATRIHIQVDNGRKVIIFDTAKQTRWYKGRKALAEIIEEQGAGWDKLRDFEPGTYELPFPTQVTALPQYDEDGEIKYCLVNEINITVDIPF